MDRLDTRLLSFKKWPLKRNQKFTKKVAKSGYHHTPTSTHADLCTCYLCGSTYHGWSGKEDPYKTHIEASMKAKDGEPCPLSAVLACAEDAVGDPNGEEEVEMRLATFVGRWPYENDEAWASLSCQKVAAAGFIYSPTDDSEDNVACPYCELALDGWEATDDPSAEHKKRTPRCPVFIGHQKKKSKTAASTSTASRSRRKAPAAAAADNENLDIAKAQPAQKDNAPSLKRGKDYANADAEGLQEDQSSVPAQVIVEPKPKRAKTASSRTNVKKPASKVTKKTTKRKAPESDAENDGGAVQTKEADVQPSPLKKLKQKHPNPPTTSESPLPTLPKSTSKPLPTEASGGSDTTSGERRPRRQRAGVVSYAEDTVDLDGKLIVKTKGKKEKEVGKEVLKDGSRDVQDGRGVEVGATEKQVDSSKDVEAQPTVAAKIVEAGGGGVQLEKPNRVGNKRKGAATDGEAEIPSEVVSRDNVDVATAGTDLKDDAEGGSLPTSGDAQLEVNNEKTDLANAAVEASTTESPVTEIGPEPQPMSPQPKSNAKEVNPDLNTEMDDIDILLASKPAGGKSKAKRPKPVAKSRAKKAPARAAAAGSKSKRTAKGKEVDGAEAAVSKGAKKGDVAEEELDTVQTQVDDLLIEPEPPETAPTSPLTSPSPTESEIAPSSAPSSPSP
ncbi:hypothetical protein HK097_008411, partial [Rhizophlyctis rosea]